MGAIDFAVGKATKYFSIASNRLNMGMDFRKIVKMRVGGRTGMFILQLMENYTKLGDFGGEAEQAALGGHHAACPGPHAVTTKNLIASHPGFIIPRHSS